MTTEPSGINGPGYREAIPDAPPLPGEPAPWRPDPLFDETGVSLLAVVIVVAAVVVIAGLVVLAVLP
jgi:hypothetical protein